MVLKELLSNFIKGDNRSVIVKKNILYSFAIKFVSIAISLLLVPMTLGYVNAELYGVWITLSSVIVWLGFFDVGFTLGLKNKLAEAIAQNDWTKGKALVSTTYFMMIIIFIPIFVILELVIPHINWAAFLNIDAVYNSEITITTHLLVAFFCMQMIVNVITSVLSAYQRVALSSFFIVLGNFISLLIIWFLTKYCEPSLVSLAFAISAMPVLVLFTVSIVLYSKQFKLVAPSVHCINKKYVKDLFGLGIRFFIIQIQVLVLYQFTNILISNVSGPLDVTYYNIAYKYLGVSMMVFTIIMSPIWPAFTDAYTKKDFPWMNTIYRRMIKLYALSVIGLILLVIISPIAYYLWVGDEVNIPFSMTVILCVYMIVHNWDSLQVYMINGIGTLKLQTYVTLIGLIFHIPLSIILGKVFSLGAYGVIVSMITINMIYSTIFTIQIRKILSKKANGIWIK